MSEHGPLTFFVTVSSADSFWPETFVEISGYKISLQEARELSTTERAELLADNPVRATVVWKNRLNALLDFLLHGKCKPIGNVRHYAIKSEWQNRCSEHAHILFWCDAAILGICTKINENGNVILGYNETLHESCEKYISAWLACPMNHNESSPDNDSSSDAKGSYCSEWKNYYNAILAHKWLVWIFQNESKRQHVVI